MKAKIPYLFFDGSKNAPITGVRTTDSVGKEIFSSLFTPEPPLQLEALFEINERLKTIEYMLRLQTWQNIPPLEEYLLTLKKRKGV